MGVKNKGLTQGQTALLLIIPVMAYYALFWLAPVYTALFESLTSVKGGFTLDNYKRVFSQPDVHAALLNTLVFTIVSMVVQFFLSIAIALILNKKFRFSNVVLFISLIPMTFPPAAVGILWKSGFLKSGWVNSILYSLHIIDKSNLIDFMSFSGLQAVLFLVVVDTWSVLPSMVIIILAGLQNLNKEYEEAGLVFGANRFQTIKDIIIPIMKPTIITATILRLIASIQIWLIAVMILGYNKVPFLVERIAYYVDAVSLDPNSKKNAFSLSIIVAVIVMVVANIYIHFTTRQAKEEE